MIAKELSAETTTVAAAMTAAPTTVHEREDAAEAIAKMAAGGFRHVPVLRSGGGLALLDVARCLYDAMTLLEDASAGGALLDAVARRCGRAPAVPPRASVVDAARALAAAPAALLLGGDGAPAALVTPRALLNVAATGGVGWFRTTRAAAVATEALPPRAPPRASVADACHVMQEQRTAHVLVAVAADDGGSPAALPPLPLLLSSVQLLAEAIEHARRAAAVRANIAKAEAARAEAAARAAETAGKAAAKRGAGGAGDGGGGVPRHHRLRGRRRRAAPQALRRRRAEPARCAAAAGCGARGVGMQMPRVAREGVPERRCIRNAHLTRHTGGFGGGERGDGGGWGGRGRGSVLGRGIVGRAFRSRREGGREGRRRRAGGWRSAMCVHTLGPRRVGGAVEAKTIG